MIVVGSGPAGQKAALCAAKLGQRVAIIDRRGMVGGVCIHTGTIPSKAIREAVLHFTGVKYRDLYGSDYTVKDRITMDDLLERARVVSRAEAGVIKRQMRRNDVHMVDGKAVFIDEHTLLVDNGAEQHHLRGDRILIAVGTNPARPAHVPFKYGKVIDSNEILQMDRLPSELCVVGGGVIGTEYAAMLAACGAKVTLVDAGPRLLSFL
ncbi:MAG: FAD-dependent oxidoreductase, partial [Planctomycetota bacterium]